MVACMVMSMVGCKGKENDPGSADATPTTAPGSTNAPDPTKAPDPTDVPKLNFNGRVVRIGAHWDLTPDPTTNQWREDWSNRIKFVEDEYNCKIEFVLVDDLYNTYVTSVLAGDPVVDVGYVMSYRLLPAFIEGGIAYPVSDLKSFDKNAYQWFRPSMEGCYYKGKYYAFGPKDFFIQGPIQYGIFYNKTLFNQYGLPDLYELYKKNEWTWDKFEEIALAGNKDLDNDGEYDIWGLNQREAFVWSFFTSNGAEPVTKTDDGLALNLESKEAKEALEGYAHFMQNVPHLTGWLGDWQSEIWSFRDGQSMMCYEAWWISTSYLIKDDGTGMVDDFGFVPFPMGPSGKEYVSFGKESSPFFMLNGVDNPEEVMQIINLIFDVYETEAEWDEMVEDGLAVGAPNAETLDVGTYLVNKNLFSPLWGFGDLRGLIENMCNDIASGASTPQTALETYKSAIDAAIADIQNYDPDKGLAEYLPKDEE